MNRGDKNRLFSIKIIYSEGKQGKSWALCNANNIEMLRKRGQREDGV